MKDKRWVLKIIGPINLVIFFCLIIFSGCATKDAVRNLSDEDALRERVNVYWSYKIKEEYDKTYLLEAPLYKKMISPVAYIRRMNPAVAYKAFDILDMTINKDMGSAEVKVGLKVQLKVPSVKPFVHDMVLTEKWVRIDGEWYHVFGDKKLTREN